MIKEKPEASKNKQRTRKWEVTKKPKKKYEDELVIFRVIHGKKLFIES